MPKFPAILYTIYVYHLIMESFAVSIVIHMHSFHYLVVQTLPHANYLGKEVAATSLTQYYWSLQHVYIHFLEKRFVAILHVLWFTISL